MQSTPPCLTADQSSSKRRRVDAADRLGDLPDCLLHRVLSYLGSRQAVQTSVLSRRWRHLWRDVPCVAIDEREFAGDQWERFEDFADRMLTSIPLETRLDAFRLHLVSRDSSMDSYATADRWIRRGLRHFPAAVDIRAAHGSTVRWQPHPFEYSRAPQLPDLSVRGSCAAGFTRRLTTLRLVGVDLMAGFVEDLGSHCPALEELHVEGCWIQNLRAVASPTLRSLAIVKPRRSAPCAHLRIVAPRLTFLHLELPYDGEDCHCVAKEAAPKPLASLAEASIRLAETADHYWLPNNRALKKRKLEFLKSMRSFLALIPNVTKLHLAGFTTTALLEEESQEFPVLHSLKTLLLEECDVGQRFQALPSILSNIPKLENLGLLHCNFSARPAKKRRNKDKGRQPVFWCENLKSIEIKGGGHHASDFVLSMISKGMQPVQWRRVKTSVVEEKAVIYVVM